MLPSRMTNKRLHRAPTTPRSWLIIITAIPRSFDSLLSKFNICACTVTSNAVVGSSAINTFGFPARAIAIQIRCCIPPEHSNGYRFIHALTSRIPTISNNSSAFSFASCRVQSVCSLRLSIICLPIFINGSRHDIAFCMMTAISPPRSFLLFTSVRGGVISSPQYRICPLEITAPFLRNPRIAIAIVDFPDPDSPTIPRISWLSSSKEQSFTTSCCLRVYVMVR